MTTYMHAACRDWWLALPVQAIIVHCADDDCSWGMGFYDSLSIWIIMDLGIRCGGGADKLQESV